MRWSETPSSSRRGSGSRRRVGVFETLTPNLAAKAREGVMHRTLSSDVTISEKLVPSGHPGRRCCCRHWRRCCRRLRAVSAHRWPPGSPNAPLESLMASSTSP
ncbi:hypothetical protein U1Q18_049263 [Sarracenia purpurea var. burkii]